MSSPKTGPVRSRLGCVGCRRSKVKCDEQHPECQRCRARNIKCHYPVPSEILERRQPYLRGLKSCDFCRNHKMKCTGPVSGDTSTCARCQALSISCQWTLQSERASQIRVRRGDVSMGQHVGQRSTARLEPPPLQSHSESSGQSESLSLYRQDLPKELSETQNIRSLLQLYFASIHHFGCLSFVHEQDFFELFDNGRAPPRLTSVMAANALRFGNTFRSSSRIDVADGWASAAGATFISLISSDFGAVELMEAVLCHHYEFLRGNYSYGWILAGVCVRMMTFLRLHILDEWSRSAPKPLLSSESLRRLAWAVYFLDATIDGGRVGYSAIRDDSMTLRLPCDASSFAHHEEIVTESLQPSHPGINRISRLGLEAHLLRAMNARQLLASGYFAIQAKEPDRERLYAGVCEAERAAELLLGTLPPHMKYSRTHCHSYKDQLPMFIHLHVFRNTCGRHLAFLRIAAAPFMPSGTNDIPHQREELIRLSEELSNILSDAIEYGVPLDPQIACHAYNALEVLLFQPLHQAKESSYPVIPRQKISLSLRPLLYTIRELAKTCALVTLLYPEAVNRMVRLGFLDEVMDEDIMAVLDKVESLDRADAEFDFDASFWRYELSRRRQIDEQTNTLSPNEALLVLPAGLTPVTPKEPSHSSVGDSAQRVSPMVLDAASAAQELPSQLLRAFTSQDALPSFTLSDQASAHLPFLWDFSGE